MDEIMLCAKT